MKILQPKNENFQIKNSDILHTSAIRNKKNNVYPCKPQVYYIVYKSGV